MLDKVVSEKWGCGRGNPAKCIQSNAALPLPLPAASRSPVNATATASPSPVKLLGGNSTVGDERERIEVEARLLPDWALREKAQRTREALAAGIAARLPDGGRRLRLWLDASLGEISNRRRDAHAAPHPHGGDGEAPVPDIVVCEICGSGSIPHLIAKCARCNAYEHRYCLQVVAYSIPHEWHCYECQEKDNEDPKCSQSQEVLMMSWEQSSMKVNDNKKNLSEMKSTANVPLNGPHMEEVQVETNPTQLQSILPTKVPMMMSEQSLMSDCGNQKNISQMKSTANILLEDPHVEAAEAEEAQDAGRRKQSSFNLNEKRKYCGEQTNSKGNKDEEEFKERNIFTHAVAVSDFSMMMNEALSNLMQEFRRWRPWITGYQKGHRIEKVKKTAAGAREVRM